jgi:hypothetical protein
MGAAYDVIMKPGTAFRVVWAVFCLIAVGARGGTWSDHFASPSLLADWKGDRSFFQIVNQELMGTSANPVQISPLVIVEVEVDSTDCSVGVWMQVVSPNTHRCTKGALVLRHTGTNGYVLALHEATQTAEVYRLSNHEMLLNRAWKIDLKKWYYVRAQAHGATMGFFIDGAEVGSVTDSESPSGGVGLAAQDANAVLFDDFTITGPGVVGNVDDVPKPEMSSVEQTSSGVTLRFTISPPYDYFVQVSSSPGPSHNWQTIASYRAKDLTQDIVFTDSNADVARFYRIEKVPCYCR